MKYFACKNDKGGSWNLLYADQVASKAEVDVWEGKSDFLGSRRLPDWNRILLDGQKTFINIRFESELPDNVSGCFVVGSYGDRATPAERFMTMGDAIKYRDQLHHRLVNGEPFEKNLSWAQERLERDQKKRSKTNV